MREITFNLIQAVFVATKGSVNTHTEKVQGMCDAIVGLLVGGMSDVWPQVRFAASQCVRSFFDDVASESQSIKDQFTKVLIAPMCFNRYCIAHGVRNFSLETWKQVF